MFVSNVSSASVDGPREGVVNGAYWDLVMGRGRRCARRPRGRAGRLPQPSRALGRAVSGRRTDRHAVAHPRRQARRAVGPERRGREQGRRLGRDRQRLRRQVGARRLHADPGHAEHARLQPDLLSQPALRPDQGLPAADPDRHGLHGAGDGAQRAGEHAEGAGRVDQEAGWRRELCLGGTRQLASTSPPSFWSSAPASRPRTCPIAAARRPCPT